MEKKYCWFYALVGHIPTNRDCDVSGGKCETCQFYLPEPPEEPEGATDDLPF